MTRPSPRPDGRRFDEVRSITFTLDYIAYPEGSVLIEMGRTWVLCNVSVEEEVPEWLVGKGRDRPYDWPATGCAGFLPPCFRPVVGAITEGNGEEWTLAYMELLRETDLSPVQQVPASMQPSAVGERETVGPFRGGGQRFLGQASWQVDNGRWRP